jgi:hypothetical protein
MMTQLPPAHLHIVLVGFTHASNGRSCPKHPGGCGEVLVFDEEDSGVGIKFRLRITNPNELGVFMIKEDGSDGCRVTYAARQYATQENAARYDGARVRLVQVFTRFHENPSCRQLAYRNFGYGDAEIMACHVLYGTLR